MEGHRAEENIYFPYIFYISKNKKKSKCGGYFEMQALMRNLEFFLFGLKVYLKQEPQPNLEFDYVEMKITVKLNIILLPPQKILWMILNTHLQYLR